MPPNHRSRGKQSRRRNECKFQHRDLNHPVWQVHPHVECRRRNTQHADARPESHQSARDTGLHVLGRGRLLVASLRGRFGATPGGKSKKESNQEKRPEAAGCGNQCLTGRELTGGDARRHAEDGKQEGLT
jgi:hypothetical protein